MTKREALALINSADSKHQSAQPILRELANGEEVLTEDVDAFVDSDSRWESQRVNLKKLANGEKLSAEDLAGMNSFTEYLKPVFIALSEGLQPDAA